MLAPRFLGAGARRSKLAFALTLGEAVDRLYVIKSLRMWEDLVLVRGWTADRYPERVTRLLLEGVTAHRGEHRASVSLLREKT